MRWAFWALAGFYVTLLLLPLAALFFRAAESDPISQFGSPNALGALRLSLVTSALTVGVALGFGTPLAYVLARHTAGWPPRKLFDALVDLPVVLPPAVAGLGLLMAFGRRGLLGGALGAFGVSLPFTTAAVVIAQTFVAAPLYVRAARIGFAEVDRQMEEAALTEGASEWDVFRFIMVPLAGRGLLSGIVLCWARALGEFGATIMFAGNLAGRTQTMPLAIYLGLESGLGTPLVLSSLLILTSLAFLWLLRRLETDHDWMR